MTEQDNSAGNLIHQAKQAILAGDAVLARQLAGSAALSPLSNDAKLILAAFSDPVTSLGLLREVLESDSENPYVHKAMRWVGTRTRQENAAQWAPAVLPEAAPSAQTLPETKLLCRAKNDHLGNGPIIAIGWVDYLWSLFCWYYPDRPVAGQQFLIKNETTLLVKPSLTPTTLPHPPIRH
jgi:hypothetical protein